MQSLTYLEVARLAMYLAVGLVEPVDTVLPRAKHFEDGSPRVTCVIWYYNWLHNRFHNMRLDSISELLDMRLELLKSLLRLLLLFLQPLLHLLHLLFMFLLLLV